MNHDHSATSDVERVRNATDIVRVVGESVDLKAKGREYVGLCPFHDDSSPSMHVVPAKQIFHCFACGAGGDAYTFVQRFHQMTFGEALRFLAERAGVTLTERTRRRTKNDDQHAVTRSKLLDANDHAQRFFRQVLKHPEHGRDPQQLIERRGISPDMVEAFGIGAAPDRWDGLLLYLSSKQLDTQPFDALGLLKTRENASGRYDALRNRLVFPIRDQIGRTIAFGARRINDDDEPKYLNSPESPLFDKSATLFGLDLASRSIQRAGTAVIAEGYTDVIACHQAGITNVVATLGTALTPKHAAVLQRLCHTVVLLFDGDQAGQRAADRAAEVFLALPIDVRIATLAGSTDAKDPDELLKRDGGDAVLRSVFERAIDLLEFRYRRLEASIKHAGPAELEARVRQDLQDLGRLGLARADKVRWQFVIQRLNAITGLPPEVIAELVRAGARRSTRPAPLPPQTEPTPSPPHGPSHGPDSDAQDQAGPPPPAPPAAREAVACLLARPVLLIGLDEPATSALESAARGTDIEPLLAAARTVAHAVPNAAIADILAALRTNHHDLGPAIGLERDISTRLGDHDDLYRDTLHVCLRKLAAKRARPAGQNPADSAADRIAELKTRVADRGADRTILPRRTAVPPAPNHQDHPQDLPPPGQS